MNYVKHCFPIHLYQEFVDDDGRKYSEPVLDPEGNHVVCQEALAKRDRHRLDMWTQGAADAYNAYAEGYDWDFSAFRKTDGYVAVPLDGLWLKAPYLHNGSVPYLAELLENPENRTAEFYRGYDVYDPDRVGFVATGPEAEKVGFRYDTAVAGNDNQGHEYGIDLPQDDKQALIEYLKTL